MFPKRRAVVGLVVPAGRQWCGVWARARSAVDTLTGLPVLQVAIIAGNFELAEYIKSHKETDIGE